VREGLYRARIDELVTCRAPSAGVDIHLPVPAPGIKGRTVRVKDVSGAANAIRVRVAGGGSVEGAPLLTMTTAFGFLTFACDGASWWRVG
jgi:hypothetical protein